MSSLRLVVAQVNPLVGDIPGNTNLVIESAKRAETEMNADVIVFPELTLMAYPPEDLLLRSSVAHRIEDALNKIIAAQLGITIVLGYPRVKGDQVFNAVGVIEDGKIKAEYAKQCLPNYLVFDEKRYFTGGDANCIVDIKGIPMAILVCEDLWESEPILKAKADGAKMVISLNASPFHIEKQSERASVLSQRVKESGLAIIYVNQIGGQDELVFDGGSLALNSAGQLCFQAPTYEAGLFPIEIEKNISNDVVELSIQAQEISPPLPRLQSIYQALVLGVRDYINKNGFKGVVLGLSGGIDSALVLAIAVDALGKDRVQAIMMPFHYTSQMSRDDAAQEAQALGVEYHSISIEGIVKAFTEALAPQFEGLKKDTTEENLQARSRGTLLMAVSNKKGFLVLTTGNKSEMAVGYATLYGDMAGGFDVLKDVAKTTVFELAEYRNTVSAVIPQNVIDRPPSAELAPDQIDADSLPPYEVLDQILAAYIEQDESAETIIAKGFKREEVEKVLRLVDLNEYKRRQSAIGPRITKRGFGRDRRYPITSGWKIGD